MVSLPPINTAMQMDNVLLLNALLIRIAVRWAKDLSVLVMNALRRAKAMRIVRQSVLILDSVYQTVCATIRNAEPIVNARR